LGQGVIYVDNSSGVTIENIDIDASGSTNGGKGLIYINGGKDTTLRNMRIHGSTGFSGNGVFGTSGNSGTLKLEGIELYDNGGTNGPAHNIYVNASASDPDYTLYFLNSWSHDSVYGHLLKSRAQVTKIEGSYLAARCRPALVNFRANPTSSTYRRWAHDGSEFHSREKCIWSEFKRHLGGICSGKPTVRSEKLCNGRKQYLRGFYETVRRVASSQADGLYYT